MYNGVLCYFYVDHPNEQQSHEPPILRKFWTVKIIGGPMDRPCDFLDGGGRGNHAPPLYPAPWTPTSLAWDRLRNHFRAAGRNSAPPKLTGPSALHGLFVLQPENLCLRRETLVFNSGGPIYFFCFYRSPSLTRE